MPPSRSASPKLDPDPTTTESPSPSPSADPIPTSPLFTASQSTGPLETEAATEEPWSQSHDGALPGDGADSPATPSAPRSTGRAKLRAIKETVRQAVATATGAAHQLLTRDGTPEREAGLWLPDDDDLEAISDPLAGLASRRAPSGVDNPDVTDLVRLALGVAGYLIKQMNVRAQIASYYAPEPQGAPPADMVDPVTDVVPPADPWSPTP
jgi:hypothetical protein